MRVVAGRLKSDYRYSNTIVYNNFIWPIATEEQKEKILYNEAQQLQRKYLMFVQNTLIRH